MNGIREIGQHDFSEVCPFWNKSVHFCRTASRPRAINTGKRWYYSNFIIRRNELLPSGTSAPFRLRHEGWVTRLQLKNECDVNSRIYSHHVENAKPQRNVPGNALVWPTNQLIVMYHWWFWRKHIKTAGDMWSRAAYVGVRMSKKYRWYMKVFQFFRRCSIFQYIFEESIQKFQNVSWCFENDRFKRDSS